MGKKFNFNFGFLDRFKKQKNSETLSPQPTTEPLSDQDQKRSALTPNISPDKFDDTNDNAEFSEEIELEDSEFVQDESTPKDFSDNITDSIPDNKSEINDDKTHPSYNFTSTSIHSNSTKHIRLEDLAKSGQTANIYKVPQPPSSHSLPPHQSTIVNEEKFDTDLETNTSSPQEEQQSTLEIKTKASIGDLTQTTLKNLLAAAKNK